MTPLTVEKLEEKRHSALVAGLRAALADPNEHRLFRSGRLDGLFSMRAGPVGDAATLALRAGYLERVRTEEKGKIVIEWVRITPAGVEFLYEHDSPRAVLGELQELLATARSGVPAWMDGVLAQLEAIAQRFATELTKYLNKLDALSQRVDEAIRRVDSVGLVTPDPLESIVPWALDALRYLDHRRDTGNLEACPMPELFRAVEARNPKMSLARFHEGLKRLADHRALKLVAATTLQLPQPEYALLDGSRVLYYVSR